MSRKDKSLDSEVNLMPFISLLSVLICALLLTAVWIQIGSMDVKQAVGGQADTSKKKEPVLWAFLQKDGVLNLQLQDAPAKTKSYWKLQIEAAQGKFDKLKLQEYLQAVKVLLPELSTVLIQPKKETVYEDIIALMDSFKSEGMINLGVAPL